MRFPCDTFTDWQANVRGIALALEALRAVDRYGVTQQAEQYRGWTALPDLRDHTYGARRHAAEDIVQMVLGCPVFPPKQSPTVQQLLDDPEERRRVQRQLMVAFHPDRQGGNDESFLEMNRLFSILNGRDD